MRMQRAVSRRSSSLYHFATIRKLCTHCQACCSLGHVVVLVFVQDEGFRDPNTGEIRRVPFEIRVEGDKQPIYEETLEDVRRFNENPALPFNAFGTLAMARAEFDANSGSSQVFFLLKVKLLMLKVMRPC